MTDKSRKTPGRDSSPSSPQFLPAHNGTPLPQQPLVSLDLWLPANVADKVRPGKNAPTKRLVLTIDDGPNTAQQRVILKVKPISTNPGPSIFDPEQPFHLAVIDETETPSAVKNMNTTDNDVTLSDILTRQQQAVTPRFFAPPTFNPRSGHASTFLSQFEIAAGRNCWDTALRLIYFGNYLEGAANWWYQEYLSDPTKKDSTWETVKADFRREYVGEDYLRELQHKLVSRKQKFAESPREYYYDLLKTVNEVDPNMPFELFKIHFENGLNRSLRENYLLIASSAVDRPSLLRAVTTLQSIHTSRITNDNTGRNASNFNTRNNAASSGRSWNNRWNANHTDSALRPSTSSSFEPGPQTSRQNYRDNSSPRYQTRCHDGNTSDIKNRLAPM
ncbi:hypothetical protein ABEB36_007853 [Hypothenemus hampei]|uniref:Retrotransposon gag domain-containing protein n=1 Tax=Hypothenemus hampei TaxID=57062 RepID=A0ABD1EWD5_HYPHA